MPNTDKDDVKTSVNYIHSCYKEQGDTSVVVVKEKRIAQYPDGTQKTKDVLRYVTNPKRTYWLTKPSARTHKYKREYENEESLDAYEVYQKDIAHSLKDNLNRTTPPGGQFYGKRSRFRDVCSNPYVYGADVDIEVLVKRSYQTVSNPDITFKFTVGSLDIETSVLGDGRICAMSYIHENKIYLAVLDDFMYKEVDNTRVKASIEDIDTLAKSVLKPYFDRFKFEIQYYNAPTEYALLKWIFKQTHINKTDFIGIWNIDYDIPKILERIKVLGKEAEQIICHPDVPQEYRYVDYYRDAGKNTEHFTDKWHWFSCSGYTQYVDKQNLFSRIRKTKGRLPKYTLDYVTSLFLGEEKLKFGHAITDHHYMQTRRFVEYAVYNIFDSVLLLMLEWNHNDFATLANLVGDSRMCDFGRQTRMLRNTFYFYCREHNKVPASAGSNMMTEFDKLLPALGGAVLDPSKTTDIGLRSLKESLHETLFHIHTWDIDVGSMYPNFEQGFNIAKETRLFTTTSIDGLTQDGIEDFYSRIHAPVENAMYIGTNYFNLPGYSELQRMFEDPSLIVAKQ